MLIFRRWDVTSFLLEVMRWRNTVIMESKFITSVVLKIRDESIFIKRSISDRAKQGGNNASKSKRRNMFGM